MRVLACVLGGDEAGVRREVARCGEPRHARAQVDGREIRQDVAWNRVAVDECLVDRDGGQRACDDIVRARVCTRRRTAFVRGE